MAVVVMTTKHGAGTICAGGGEVMVILGGARARMLEGEEKRTLGVLVVFREWLAVLLFCGEVLFLMVCCT
ncbi:hypothetical protein JTE90_001443 [Oedothorax gibbosus]|uniref:NADH dehydrogenase subunit 6 n=1 Tax=Oedothorax gibbosus TaxID=931172 RepID=A0AAV6V280_9ARAC|nr:hypothetical protein JTE90_001443 [Oedothorax gibbosus]